MPLVEGEWVFFKAMTPEESTISNVEPYTYEYVGNKNGLSKFYKKEKWRHWKEMGAESVEYIEKNSVWI